MIDAINLIIEKRDFFIELLLQHIEISSIAIIIAIFLGGCIGIFISEYTKFAKSTISSINFLYTIPSISMLGFLIPFSGIGDKTAIITLTIYALLPMVKNTYTGLTNVDARLIEASKGMGSTKFQTLYKIKIPLAMPIIMTGIRSMVTMTIALAGIASFIGAGGLGVSIYRGITTNNKAMTMAGSILIAFLALFVDFILSKVEKNINNKSKSKTKINKSIFAIFILLFLVIIGDKMVTKKSDDTINIATKPMTEQYILGEMLKIVIENDTNLNVNLTQGVGGGTSNIMPAMESSEFDIYPEYTGTGWNMVLKEDSQYNEDMFNELNSEYNEKYNMNWVSMYGFNNTYGLAVNKDIAQKYNLKTYSDLKGVSKDLVFGGEYDFFGREDGYSALCDAYGLEFSKTMDMDIGLKYKAIEEGKIDIMNIFTTDAMLNSPNIVVLEDDMHFYPSYMCGNIVRNEVLDEYPQLIDVFKKLDGILDDKTMTSLNYEVEINGLEPNNVAREFLENNNLLN